MFSIEFVHTHASKDDNSECSINVGVSDVRSTVIDTCLYAFMCLIDGLFKNKQS